MKEYSTEIKEFVNSFNKKRPVNIKYKYPKEYQQLIDATSFLPDDSPFRQRQYHIVNNVVEIPKCANSGCSNEVNWLTRENRYLQYCSNACNHNHGELNKKRKQTIKQKYGVDHYSQTEEFKEKHKNTCLQRYGVNHHNQKQEFKDKIQQSKLEIYGNVNNTSAHISDDVFNKINNKNWLVKQHHHNKRTLSDIAGECGISLLAIQNRFKMFNIKIKRYYTSTAERDIFNFIREHITDDVIIEQRYRKLKKVSELDIFIPAFNIAFEYNGLYWHNDELKNKYHLLEKTQECSKQGIRLVHINENEWLNKTDIVKSRLISLLGNSNKIFARKCMIRKVSNKDKDIFLVDNHIQGTCVSSYNIGLYHDDKLVALMTFSKSRMSKKYEYELVRYCSQKNHNVVGGASKLFKKFVNEVKPSSVVSYSDNRWNTGDLYTQLNFSFLHDSSPNYLYFKTSGNQIKTLSRYQCQKHKLGSILPVFDNNLSEYINMKNNGYKRIWDCGNSVYLWLNK